MLDTNFRQCPTGAITYIIKAGDTLYKIAKSNNITVTAIMNLNPGINPYKLYIGQRICIPYSCDDGYLYNIRLGDTLYRIAALIGIPLSTLLGANPGINPNNLLVGQIICIPSFPGALPLIKRIPVFVEGMTDYREARLQRSIQNYYIYVLDIFSFTAEEPGRDLLFSNYDNRFFVRIEKLPNNADVNQLRSNALFELQDIGTPVEMKGEEIFDPFFRNARFFLHASSSTISKNIILIYIGNSLFKFTMNMPNSEAAEGLIPSMYAMLKTIFVR